MAANPSPKALTPRRERELTPELPASPFATEISAAIDDYARALGACEQPHTILDAAKKPLPEPEVLPLVSPSLRASRAMGDRTQ